MAEPGKPNDAGLDRAKLKQYVVPAVAVAAVVVLVGLVISVSGAVSRNMSDGSDGTAGDSKLKDLSPGVRYRDIKEGLGEECPPGADVTMHYTGWFDNGEVFDSSREKGAQPVKFALPNLIKGWQEGIPGMKPGGIRKLVISADKGYGAQGRGKIPGNATLIFEVELVSFAPPPPPPVPPRPRRTPAPTDLTKLSDGSAPGARDPGLKPLGNSGLMYRDLKEGDGPVCPEGATVVMDYIGWLTSGGTPFDSSWNPGREPLDMSLGGLIKGWQQGVPGMKVGGIRKLVIPPDLGYGSQDKGKIPPNSTLVFEIELLGFK
jgi:peptidylprolyl isomerase